MATSFHVPTAGLVRTAGRVSLIGAAVFLASVLGAIGLLLFWSYPGRPKPFVDERGDPLPGSIAEKDFRRH